MSARRWLRITAVMAGGASLLVPAAPSSAHQADHGAMAVSPGGVVADTSAPRVNGRIEVPLQEVVTLGLTVRPTGSQPAGAQTVDGCAHLTSGQCGSSSVVEFAWSPTLAYNGPYVAESVAQHRALGGVFGVEPPGPATPPVQFTMAVPPRQPSNVSAQLQPDRTVRLSWARNTEPDMVGYLITRKRPSSDAYETAGTVEQPTSGNTVSFTDPTPAQEGGIYDYRVQAFRQGAAPGDLNTVVGSPIGSISTAVPPPGAAPGPPPGPSAVNNPAPGGSSSPAPGPSLGDLSGVLSRAGQSSGALSSLPSVSIPEAPDTGFNPQLPTGSGAAAPRRPSGNRPAASIPRSSRTGSSDDNRRALLIPLAAGLLLCVTALHLRWLSRRLAASGADAQTRPDGWDAGALEGQYLDPVYRDDDYGPPPREPVGSGVGRSSDFR